MLRFFINLNVKFFVERKIELAAEKTRQFIDSKKLNIQVINFKPKKN